MDVTKFGSLWQNGPVPGEFYNFPSARVGSGQDVLTKYQHGLNDNNREYIPVITGTSVIGMAYKDGVIIAADNLVSFGSLARYRNCDRVIKINNKIILGCGGDYADFHFIRSEIEKKTKKDSELNDNNELKPHALYNWMTTLLYNRRCDRNPLFVDLVIGGINDANENEKPFLGHVSIRGKAYRADAVTTGFGSHLALPLMREFLQQKQDNIMNITRQEAQDIVKKCMEILYYRDCRAYSRYLEGSVVRKEKNVLSTSIEPKIIEENWNVAKMIEGYN